MIDHLSARYDLSTTVNTAVVFVYCTYDDSALATKYIRAAISQLCHRMQFLPPSLLELYQNRHITSDPSLQELRDTFLEIIRKFHTIFFVLDALDSCARPQDLCRFLCDIIATPEPIHSGIVKVLVMSRMDPDIKEHLKASMTIQIQPADVDIDIEAYVKARVAQLSQYSHITFNPALKNKMLSVKPYGM